MPEGILDKLRSQFTRQPLAPGDRWLTLGSKLVVLGCIALLPAFSFGRDQGIYATVGSGILTGSVPYRDLWDFKPPGIFFIFALAEALFGHSMAAPRLLEAIGLFVMALGMARLSEHWYGSRAPGWMGAAIACIVHVELDFWHSGQPESFGGIATVLALWLAVTPSESKQRIAKWAVAGALLGFSALLKPPLGGAGLILLAYLARQQQVADQKRQLWFGLAALASGAALPFVLVFGWFWIRGGWAAMVWTLRDFVPGYTSLGWQGDHRALEMFYFACVESLTRFSALIALGVAAALMLPTVTDLEQSGSFLLLGCAIVQVTGIALQAKFFQYHYGATTPLLSLLAGLGWYKLWIRARSKSAWAVPALGAAAFAALLMRKPVKDVPGTVPERTWARLQFYLHRPEFDSREKLDASLHRAADYDLGADRQVAAWVAANTKPSDTVLVWGFEPVVYWLTGRKPATRFIYDVPQRSQWQTETSQRLFMDDVTKNKPAVVVVQHNDVFPGVTGHMTDSAADLERFAALDRYIEEQYNYVTVIEDFDIYRRKE